MCVCVIVCLCVCVCVCVRVSECSGRVYGVYVSACGGGLERGRRGEVWEEG